MPLDYFDPVGFCKQGDQEGFRNLRAAELKHGRVAMMAALGAVAQHYVRFPGFENVPSGLQATSVAPGNYGMAALVVLVGVLESSVWVQDPRDEPGDFGDPLGLGMYSEDMRSRELNNGRMAMFAIMGILLAEYVSGKDGVDQILAVVGDNAALAGSAVAVGSVATAGAAKAGVTTAAAGAAKAGATTAAAGAAKAGAATAAGGAAKAGAASGLRELLPSRDF